MFIDAQDVSSPFDLSFGGLVDPSTSYELPSGAIARTEGLAELTTEIVDNNVKIRRKDVRAGLNGWMGALEAISEEHHSVSEAAAKDLASAVIDAAYGYNLGPVSFKPTWACGDRTFRPTSEGALAYFLGGDDNFPGDVGYAIGSIDRVTGERSQWVETDFQRSHLFLDGDTAFVQGLLTTTDQNGKSSYVEKTFGFQKDGNGDSRIILHHSSRPYVSEGSTPKIEKTKSVRCKDSDQTISVDEILAIQAAWEGALVGISQEYQTNGMEAATKLAEDAIDGVYGYELGAVAFKPTWTSGTTTFRPEREGAISYFVGSEKYDDSGFAIGTPDDATPDEKTPWVDAEFENAVIRINGDIANVTGFLHTKPEGGSWSYVDKTMVFKKDDDGVLRIVAHHSSSPYDKLVNMEEDGVDSVEC